VQAGSELARYFGADALFRCNSPARKPVISCRSSQEFLQPSDFFEEKSGGTENAPLSASRQFCRPAVGRKGGSDHPVATQGF
jgi:hypothetical protein